MREEVALLRREWLQMLHLRYRTRVLVLMRMLDRSKGSVVNKANYERLPVR